MKEYDLDRETPETENLAASYPDRVKKMAARCEEEAVRLRVKPWLSDNQLE